MKTEEIIPSSDRIATKIAKQFVDEASKNFVPEDVDKALEQMITRFSNEIRKSAKTELKFRQMRQVFNTQNR